MSNNSLPQGTFRKKKGFTVTSNEVLRNRKLSCKAKGLYCLIQSWITYEEITLTKAFLRGYCPEGDRAFDSMWNELRDFGYLKIHAYLGERGRCYYEYELLDEADLRDGVYLYRYDIAGNLTSTNKGPVEQVSDHTLQNVPDGHDHPPQNYPCGNHPGGDDPHSNYPGSNRRDKYNNYNNPEINTVVNPPITMDGEDEAVAKQVAEEIAYGQAIPYAYATQPEKMKAAVELLCSYPFRQEHPYKSNGVLDTPRQNAFNMMVSVLVEMATDLKGSSCRGALVNYAHVIDHLNKACTDWEEGGLEEFIESALDDFLAATANGEIKSVRNYMKSVIWTSLTSYKVKQDAAVNHLLHRKR